MDMDISQLDLRWIESFIILAEELHFGRAAARLGMAQPQLSHQVKRLEETIGFDLFVRTSRHVSLTAPGAAFLESASKTIKELKRSIHDAQRLDAGDQGTLAIGYVASAMLTILPKVIRRYRAAYPGVRIEMFEVSSAPQLESLAARKLDIAIVTGDVPVNLLRRVALREPLVAVLPSNHALAARRRIALAALADEQYILFPRAQTPLLYADITNACANAGFSPRIVQVAQTWHAIVSLVSAGMGITLAPASVGRFRVAGVKLVPLSGTPLEVIVNACALPDAGTAAKRFLNMVDA